MGDLQMIAGFVQHISYPAQKHKAGREGAGRSCVGDGTGLGYRSDCAIDAETLAARRPQGGAFGLELMEAVGAPRVTITRLHARSNVKASASSERLQSQG